MESKDEGYTAYSYEEVKEIQLTRWKEQLDSVPMAHANLAIADVTDKELIYLFDMLLEHLSASLIFSIPINVIRAYLLAQRKGEDFENILYSHFAFIVDSDAFATIQRLYRNQERSVH